MARSSFNVSLQRKHNKIVLGPLIERCEEEGGVISDVIVEYVEKALDYEKMIGLNKVMQTYKIIQNMVGVQHPYGSPEYIQAVESVLKRVIRIDGEELSQFLSDPNGYVGGDLSSPLSSIPPIAQQVTAQPIAVQKETVSNDAPPKSSHPETTTVSVTSPATTMEKEDDDEEEKKAEKLRQKRAEARRKKKEEEALLRAETNDEEEDDEVNVENLNIGALFNS